MPEERIASIRWNDLDAADRALTSLQQEGRVRIDLPADFHHTLFAHVCRGDEQRHEYIDARGGAELLASVAEIRLLRDLAPLADYVASVHATVRIQSPAPTIIIERSE